MFNYAPYKRGSFLYVSKDLSVVPYWLECNAAEQAYNQANSAYLAADDIYTRSTKAACNELKAKLRELVGTSETPLKPVDVFQIAVNKSEHALTTARGNTAMAHKYLREAATACLPIFCTFDEAAYDKMVTELFGKDDPLGKARSETLKARNKAGADFKNSMMKYSGCFSDLSFLVGCEKGREYRRAYEEATRVISTWRNRARQFDVPVTIECVVINSLQEDIKKVWSEAYRALGFDSMPKKPLYRPFIHKELV